MGACKITGRSRNYGKGEPEGYDGLEMLERLAVQNCGYGGWRATRMRKRAVHGLPAQEV